MTARMEGIGVASERAAPVLLALALGAAGFLPGAPATAQEASWSGSVEVASGDYYFTERSTSVWVVNGVSASWGGVYVDASLPLLLQNSDAITRAGGLPVPTGGNRAGDGSGRRHDELVVIEAPGSLELSLADPLLGAGLEFTPTNSPLRSVRVGASVKPPLRSAESGIGTGEWDAGAGAGASLELGSVLVMIQGSYWALGDTPDLELRDVFAYGAALGGFLRGDRLGWSVSVTGSTSMIDGVEAPVSIGGDVYLSLASARSLRAGVRSGLTESAADVAASVGWTIPLL
ncbi:MAG: hypothetical protein ABFS34_10885 [Gemmatimonadota bacterium]